MTSVLFLLSDLEMGGSQRKIINVANHLAKRGCDVRMMVLGGPYTLQNLISSDVTFVDLERCKRYEWRLVGVIRRYSVRHAIGELCIVGAYPLIYAMPALRLKKARPRLTLALNSTYFRDAKERLQMCLYIPLMYLLDRVLFGCNFQMDHWRSRYRVGKRGSRVIYNGIDTAWYSCKKIASGREFVRRQCNMQTTDFVIGSVGKFRPEKGYEYLIEAAYNLANKGIYVKVLLVGTGIQENILRDRVAELGLQDQVIFYGEIEDVRPALAAMDVFVLSSVAVETFSNAALEAMAMSLPVILSRLSGAPEMIEDGVQGLLYPPTDAAALAACIERLTDAGQREQMGVAARSHVVERFSIDRMVDDYEKYFEIK